MLMAQEELLYRKTRLAIDNWVFKGNLISVGFLPNPSLISVIILPCLSKLYKEQCFIDRYLNHLQHM